MTVLPCIPSIRQQTSSFLVYTTASRATKPGIIPTPRRLSAASTSKPVPPRARLGLFPAGVGLRYHQTFVSLLSPVSCLDNLPPFIHTYRREPFSLLLSTYVHAAAPALAFRRGLTPSPRSFSPFTLFTPKLSRRRQPYVKRRSSYALNLLSPSLMSTFTVMCRQHFPYACLLQLPYHCATRSPVLS